MQINACKANFDIPFHRVACPRGPAYDILCWNKSINFQHFHSSNTFLFLTFLFLIMSSMWVFGIWFLQIMFHLEEAKQRSPWAESRDNDLIIKLWCKGTNSCLMLGVLRLIQYREVFGLEVYVGVTLDSFYRFADVLYTSNWAPCLKILYPT